MEPNFKQRTIKHSLNYIKREKVMGKDMIIPFMSLNGFDDLYSAIL